ncbi:MAG: uracil-DNA glycosylase [Actinobacteria bacterium]|nr:uracil-DNA glycosylase [Actinomycetota bacterium]MCL5883362.1 uracil-DNA glycosylase [Actinomycetota bacterium]
MAEPGDREERLKGLQVRVGGCRKCALGETRTNLVFGSGSADSKLMFVGEAPGYHEDQQGMPFVGRAGTLLEKLLTRIGLTRSQVYIANVLKCRPPDNRDPLIEEIQLCRSFLEEQISIISPAVICTLGNFATKLLTGRPDGISRVHGKAQEMPQHQGTKLFPVYHPAAALYTPANLKALEADFDLLPALLGENKPQPGLEVNAENSDPLVEFKQGQPEPEQLGLF